MLKIYPHVDLTSLHSQTMATCFDHLISKFKTSVLTLKISNKFTIWTLAYTSITKRLQCCHKSFWKTKAKISLHLCFWTLHFYLMCPLMWFDVVKTNGTSKATELSALIFRDLKFESILYMNAVFCSIQWHAISVKLTHNFLWRFPT